MRWLLALSLAASSASALQLVASLRPAPTSVSTSSISMRARFDDAEDRRLSKGGSGGRFGKTAPKKNRALGVSGMDKYTQSDIRQKKLDAYVNNDLEPTDGTISKIIAGFLPHPNPTLTPP